MRNLAEIQLPPDVQRLVDQIVWSWNHHYTLPLLAAGLGALLVTWIAVRREWSVMIIALSAVAGVICLSGSVVVAMLGAEMHRGQGTFEREMFREIRATHGGSAQDVAIGAVCKATAECSPSAACVRVDDAPRCWPKCDKDGACAEGLTCSSKHGAKICLATK
jgi:hypothetical protein